MGGEAMTVTGLPGMAPASDVDVQRVLTLDSVHVEHRAADGEAGSEAILFRGHAAVFDEWTLIGGEKWGFYERVQRGAFRKALAEGQDVRFLGLNHDSNTVMARTTNGTLTLREDPKGLLVEADLAPTQGARDLAILLERGDLSQMSFGFRVGTDIVEEADGELPRRTITEFRDLFDVSVVTYPAYEGTDAGLARSMEFRQRFGDEHADLAAMIAAASPDTVDDAVARALTQLAPAAERDHIAALLGRRRRLHLLDLAA
jgi:uncharacterized protein